MHLSNKQPSRLRQIWILYCKEWFRLKRNPAALMAAGLIVLMAFLINIESKKAVSAKRAENTSCLVVFNEEDGLIKHLKNQKLANKLRFTQLETDLAIDLAIHPQGYAENVFCPVEISREVIEEGKPSRKIRFRHKGAEFNSVSKLARMTLYSIATFRGEQVVEQSFKPIETKSFAPATAPSIDLGSNQSRAMVGAMIIFSAQFFLCCALFISFTAHERERGILQDLALTRAKPLDLFFAKVFFHLSLSIIACLCILLILRPTLFDSPVFSLIVLGVITASSLGMICIASIVCSLVKNQATASLAGFCYIMVMGVIFALSGQFIAFQVIRDVMFEYHSIALFVSLLSPRTELSFAVASVHTIALLLIISILFLVACTVWNKFTMRS